MNRIENAFRNKKAFLGFVTAGDPSIEKTEEFIMEMERAGADLIEIGIPFSDPVAEGTVIEAANERALLAGTTPAKIFEMVNRIREKSNIPLVFLTYLNPVFHYGYQEFFTRCEQVGVDGIIIPDLPFEEKKEVAEIAKTHRVAFISLIAPTSEQRITQIAKEAEGFIYLVSSMGVTGVRREIETDLGAMLAAIRNVSKQPVAVGFGISTKEQAARIANQADGVIVGSAIVKIIEKEGTHCAAAIYEYVKGMKDAIR